MRSKKKILILSVVVFVAVIIPIFLKLFSSNVFKIPVLAKYDEISDCGEILTDHFNDHILVFFIRAEPCNVTGCKEEIDQLKRVALRYRDLKNLDFKIIADQSFKVNWEEGDIDVITTDAELDLPCLFKDDLVNQLVLFDQSNNLRGQYKIEREEVDRLMVELEILNTYGQ